MNKPRSMERVMSDINFSLMGEDAENNITNILTDISQLKAQLNSIELAIKKNNIEIAVNIINPAMKYYKKSCLLLNK
ncbi:MAG: hypothetical protein ACJASR_000135 [Psychroserpens sp.]|jgi:hypothetical protein